MMNSLIRIRIISTVLLTVLMILSIPQTSFGTDETVVKPYNDEWVLVRKDAFDFFVNEAVTWKTKYERAMEVRESERDSWLLERAIFKEALDSANEQSSVYNRELIRLNHIIDRMARASRTKDIIMITSIVGNLIQAAK